MGYSSQGPQVWREEQSLKPDVCAPSQFCEDNNASIVNSGTSTAAALTAGAIAAIRGSTNPAFAPRRLPPRGLKKVMLATARNRRRGWNNRTGHGLLWVGKLIDELKRPTPGSTDQEG
jgi:subtilisin family serine protease